MRSGIEHAFLARPSDPWIHASLLFALDFDVAATPESLPMEPPNGRPIWLSPVPPSERADPERRASHRICSSHFASAATYAFGGVIVHHDPEQLEIVCYSDTAEEDDLSAHLRNAAHKWRRTIDLSDDRLVELVRKDQIDILVDLVGHMKGDRLAYSP